MSDATATPTPEAQPPTLRLLEPRALAGADRLVQRMSDRALPLMRGVSNGVSRFADRVFDYWIGRTYERAPMGVTARSPQQLQFPVPWYELPSQRAARPATPSASRAPIRVPVTITAPAPGAPAEVAAVEEPRAFELVNAYAARLEPAETPPAPRPRVEQAPRPSLAARLVERLGSVDAMLRVVLGPIAAPAPSEPARAAAPALEPVARAAPPRVHLVEIGAEAPRSPALSAGLTASPAVERTAAPVSTPRAFAAPPAARLEPTLTLTPGLPAAAPASWPRLQRFLERLAGPTSLAQAGVVEPAAALVRSVQSFAGELVAPLDAPSATRPVSGVIAAPRSERAPAIPSLGAPPRLAPVAELPTASPALESAPFVAPAAPEPVRPAATLLGALADLTASRAATEGVPVEPWRPGRLAQRAELIGRIAEQRVARQLGFAPEAPAARSVRWSADAFTVLELAPEPQQVPSPRRDPAASTATRAAAPIVHALVPGPTSPTAIASVPPAAFPSARIAVAEPEIARPAPFSVAALLAFADAQLGPRLLGGTRPLTVRMPEPVYIDPTEPSRPQQAASRPVGAAAPRPPLTTTWSPALVTPTLEHAAPFVSAAPTGAPPATAAHEPAPATELSIAQVGRRSEQLAGELGVRVGALSSEFLFDVLPEDEASPTPAPRARAGAMSTSEWVLLSIFPSQATAQQVAQAIDARAAAASSPGVAPSRGAVVAPSMPQLAAVAPAGASSVAGSSAPSPASTSVGRRAPLSAQLVVERGMSLVQGERAADEVAPGTAPIASAAARAPLTAVLPDGRAPRGSRLLARAAMPTVSASPMGSPAIQAAGEAANRRVDAPVSAPLWGHLRPMVDVSAAPAEPELGSARATALELVAPFVETARTQTGAASFAREAMPVVAARAPDDSTKSLVTALSAASNQSASDRLSLADLTLISIVSATDQVAASGRGAGPSASSLTGPDAGGAGSGARLAVEERGRDLAEVKRIADLVRAELEHAEQRNNNRGRR